MNNFQSVNKASLNYRLYPRLFLVLFIAAVLLIVLFVGFGFLKFTHPLLLSFGISFIFFLLFTIITFLSAYLEYSNLRYMIEENAVFLKEGVLRVDTETIPFQKIRNASFLQSLTQRIFRVGNLVIDQEPENYTWIGIDIETARIILDAVSAKSNIQPISVSANAPIPLQHNQPNNN